MNKPAIYLLLPVIVLLSACTKVPEGQVKDFFYLRNDGADMPIWVEGNLASGAMIVILHGGPGGDSEIYNSGLAYFSDPLESNYAVAYYDQRGAGVSQGHYPSSRLTVAQHVEDLEKLLVLLKHKYGEGVKYFLMGHSWGGTLGTAFLLKQGNQDKVAGWIEVDGAHNFSATRETVDNFRVIGQTQVTANNNKKFWNKVLDYCDDVNVNNPSDENLSKLNGYAYDGEKKLVEDEVILRENGVDNLEAIGDQLDYSLFSSHIALISKINLWASSSGIGMFDEVKNIDYTSRLGEITLPALILWGRYDLVLPVTLGQQAYDNIGTENFRKRFVIFDYSGHSPMAYQPEAFLEVLTKFVNDNLN